MFEENSPGSAALTANGLKPPVPKRSTLITAEFLRKELMNMQFNTPGYNDPVDTQKELYEDYKIRCGL
jgi:hypothetical protein